MCWNILVLPFQISQRCQTLACLCVGGKYGVSINETSKYVKGEMMKWGPGETAAWVTLPFRLVWCMLVKLMCNSLSSTKSCPLMVKKIHCGASAHCHWHGSGPVITNSCQTGSSSLFISCVISEKILTFPEMPNDAIMCIKWCESRL